MIACDDPHVAREREVEFVISRVHPEDRGLEHFHWGGNDEDVLFPDCFDDAFRYLLVSPPKDEALASDDTHYDFCFLSFLEMSENLLFSHVPCHQLPVFHEVHAKKGFLDAEFLGNLLGGGARANDEEGVLLIHEFLEIACDLFLGKLVIHALVEGFSLLHEKPLVGCPGEAEELHIQPSLPERLLVDVHDLGIAESALSGYESREEKGRRCGVEGEDGRVHFHACRNAKDGDLISHHRVHVPCRAVPACEENEFHALRQEAVADILGIFCGAMVLGLVNQLHVPGKKGQSSKQSPTHLPTGTEELNVGKSFLGIPVFKGFCETLPCPLGGDGRGPETDGLPQDRLSVRALQTHRTAHARDGVDEEADSSHVGEVLAIC